MEKKQVKSRERVAAHGEVFTAEREVKAMCDLVKSETERIDSRFLEPACGDGNFLAEILSRKLACEQIRKYRKSSYDWERNSLLALGSLYGVDILADNCEACRERLYGLWEEEYHKVCKKECNDDTRAAARFILARNIVCGNALSLMCVDENGKDTSDAKRVIDNINSKAGGGILPLGGSSPATGSHKGYGLALIVEILSSIIAGGATSNHVSKNGLGDTSQSFFALDYGMFGDKAAMRESLSTLLQELRDSAKAEGRTRIYTSGEMEVDSRNEKLKNGIPVNDSTLAELRTVGGELGLDFDAMVSVKAAE